MGLGVQESGQHVNAGNTDAEFSGETVGSHTPSWQKGWSCGPSQQDMSCWVPVHQPFCLRGISWGAEKVGGGDCVRT